MEREFGPVSILHGLFGVSCSPLLDIATELTQWAQSKWLHIYDPRAMHSIAVKDRDAYEEVPFFREYVLQYVLERLLTGPTQPPEAIK